MANSKLNRKESRKSGNDQTPVANRTWSSSVFWSTLTMAALLVLAVVGNLAVGRVIHWEIVSVLGVLGFVFLTIGRRYRTI